MKDDCKREPVSTQKRNAADNAGGGSGHLGGGAADNTKRSGGGMAEGEQRTKPGEPPRRKDDK